MPMCSSWDAVCVATGVPIKDMDKCPNGAPDGFCDVCAACSKFKADFNVPRTSIVKLENSQFQQKEDDDA